MRRLSHRRVAGISLVMLGLWLVLVLLSLNIGSVPIGPRRSASLLWHGLLHGSGGTPAEVILFSVRLPRILLGSLVGGALAVAGTAFQCLLRNPLADPYVLGVSTGASTGTIVYSIVASSWGAFMASAAGIYGRPLAAFLGAVLTVAAVYVVGGAGRQAGEGSQRLLLAGVVLASFLSSINVFLLTGTDQADLRGIFYWLIGDLSRPVDASIYLVAAVVFAGFFVLYGHGQSLNLLSAGEEDALILGVEVRRVKAGVYLVASLITGAVVSVSGPIAYIGLICPHLGRMLFGSDNRILLPAVLVFGAIFTLGADTMARTVLAPVELPVGVITAICGAPLFIYLLYRRRYP